MCRNSLAVSRGRWEEQHLEIERDEGGESGGPEDVSLHAV